MLTCVALFRCNFKKCLLRGFNLTIYLLVFIDLLQLKHLQGPIFIPLTVVFHKVM